MTTRRPEAIREHRIDLQLRAADHEVDLALGLVADRSVEIRTHQAAIARRMPVIHDHFVSLFNDVVTRLGGTVTHHHAVGRDHRSGYKQDTSSAYRDALRAVKASLDPHGVMNPGVLIDPLGRKVGIKSFLVTAIGCGIAGHDPADIAPLFAGASENVFLSEKLVAALRQKGNV